MDSKILSLWLMKASLSCVCICTQEPITLKRASFRDKGCQEWVAHDGGMRCTKYRGASHQVFDDAVPCKSRGIWSIGAVGRCLSRQLAESKPLTLECRSLVLVAAPRVGALSSPASSSIQPHY